ncbi:MULTISPECIES: hypothetical protein [unclassified Moorena]|uniref:hypothetical protein n=1 Tax=unclassified Moorena TaxID=2683338 RepID=UPI0013FE9FDD|nr:MULTISPECIES: hypothetical protein [unclassified Moorena]NEO16713.1 hypothetical protein [Moorena sp. SIO3E8]NEQ03248.1 hypothetical protein [Moorena sp. SIO3F7]
MASWLIVNWTTITHYQKRVKIFSGRHPIELGSVLSHGIYSFGVRQPEQLNLKHLR